MQDLRRSKEQMRRLMQERRAEAHKGAIDAGRRLAEQFYKHVVLKTQVVVSGFMPFGSEIDMEPLMSGLRQRGHVLALPVVVGKGQPLQFRRFDAGDRLERVGFGLMEPLASAAVVEPDILLVPLLAFDAQGYRLGYGGGFYDRTITGLRAQKSIVAVGIGYDCQRVDAVPRGETDARLDKIVTEIHAFHV